MLCLLAAILVMYVRVWKDMAIHWMMIFSTKFMTERTKIEMMTLFTVLIHCTSGYGVHVFASSSSSGRGTATLWLLKVGRKESIYGCICMLKACRRGVCIVYDGLGRGAPSSDDNMMIIACCGQAPREFVSRSACLRAHLEKIIQGCGAHVAFLDLSMSCIAMPRGQIVYSISF